MNYEKLRENRFNQWFMVHLRYLLGVAFIPSGYTKLIGNRFTQISTDHPIGYFFEGLYQSGFYYQFIGFAQLLAGFLLMTQRLATFGNLIYFSLITNICIITISLSFKGTWLITSLMLFASTVLLIWDYQKLKPIFSYPSASRISAHTETSVYWQITGLVYFLLFISFSIFDLNTALKGFVAGLIFITFAVTNTVTYLRYRRNKKNADESNRDEISSASSIEGGEVQ
ncbi:DoxX family membrane protein [Kaistella sp. DKR-2]|uniref:DoxX family membrane protein n=1 Tax=Kaistella soli TaxID=2849654 RepID=UPI001C25287A|nr:DoxX family membrane protein [Kaistella soli]MBU8882064.1 DoxX family membrane protein [Kaistella soli]